VIRNNHWYNINEQNAYPIDDTASCLSNEGHRLSSSLIADMQLRWNRDLGKYAFISAVTCSEFIVTLLIEVTDQLDNTNQQSKLIAGISLEKASLTPYRTYRLETFERGVAGFITFGSNTDELFRGVFSSPLQTRLTAKAARPIRKPPLETLGIANIEKAVSGLVRLNAEQPLEIVKEARSIGGVVYDNVIVFRLKEPPAATATQNTESVFSQFAGPCGRRVGSRSCVDPQPIESINGLSPDCDGTLTLEFQGCAIVGKTAADCGVVVDCEYGLSDTCAPPFLPELDTGKLPSEVPAAVIPDPDPPEPPVQPDISISDSMSTLLSLPYCDTFDDGFAYSFSPMDLATWGMSPDDSPEEAFCCVGPPPNNTAFGCESSISDSQSASVSLFSYSYGTANLPSLSRTNISLFTLDSQSLYRRYTTDLKVISLSTASKNNAGIIVNYRLNSADLYTYVFALLDIDNLIFGVYYFNGINAVPLSTIAVPSAAIDQWYHLELTVTPNEITRTSVNLQAVLKSVDTALVDVAISTSLPGTLWETDAGNAGFYTKRSAGYFSYWRIDEAVA
jgi:hypothetical protein